MPEQLIVITGAGASFDATHVAPVNWDWRPPLVTQLFEERPSFTTLLARYPDAQSLAPDLRAASRVGSVGLEAYLRDHVLGSKLAYDRRRYTSIPLYLQHVLHEVGAHFTPHPVNYDRLVNAALRGADEVLFLTLNYDTLLDGRLSHHTPICDLPDYINPEAAWRLIKLHGSVNWVREITNPIELGSEGDYLQLAAASLGNGLRVSDNITMLDRNDVVATRRPGPERGRYFYPAISVPLGAEDEFNCPPEHVAHARERLGALDGLHLLTIGYSGLDSGLLNLLRDTGNALRSLYVVNEGPAPALEAAQRIASVFGQDATPEMASELNFSDFAHGSAIDAYFAQLD